MFTCFSYEGQSKSELHYHKKTACGICYENSFIRLKVQLKTYFIQNCQVCLIVYHSVTRVIWCHCWEIPVQHPMTFQHCILDFTVNVISQLREVLFHRWTERVELIQCNAGTRKKGVPTSSSSLWRVPNEFAFSCRSTWQFSLVFSRLPQPFEKFYLFF